VVRPSHLGKFVVSLSHAHSIQSDKAACLKHSSLFKVNLGWFAKCFPSLVGRDPVFVLRRRFRVLTGLLFLPGLDNPLAQLRVGGEHPACIGFCIFCFFPCLETRFLLAMPRVGGVQSTEGRRHEGKGQGFDPLPKPCVFSPTSVKYFPPMTRGTKPIAPRPLW
jgi:hypothetical protein